MSYHRKFRKLKNTVKNNAASLTTMAITDYNSRTAGDVRKYAKTCITVLYKFYSKKLSNIA